MSVVIHEAMKLGDSKHYRPSWKRLLPYEVRLAKAEKQLAHRGK